MLLPLDAVVCQGERGWGLLAWPVVVEAVRSHVAGAPVHLLVEIYVDVHAAGVFRGLHVEGLGHRLRRGVELELHVVVLAPCHVLADVGRDADAVVGPYVEILDSELHRVVSGLYIRVAPPCGALPAAVGELLAILVVVGPVPTFVPALVAVSFRVLVALVEGLVVPLLLPLDAVRR